jgi:hypothetical protein
VTTPPTDAQLDAALDAINAPGRLDAAQNLVTRVAPALQKILGAAMADGGWFDSAHEQVVREATGGEDHHERIRAVRTLLAEETRLGMLVGVAIGFELAQELGGSAGTDSPTTPKED